jgi:SAM-dependent methyltransferase
MLKDWNEYSFLFDWELHAINSHQLNDYKAWLRIHEKFTGKALEIGCGHGRISKEFAKAGRDISAIDLSKNMINKFRKDSGQVKLENIHCGDMLTYEFPEKYNFAFYSYSTFQYLLSADEQITALKHIHTYLEPGGYVGIDVCPYTCDLPLHQAKTLLYKRHNKEINKQVSMYTSHRVDRIQQITSWEDTYVLEDKGNREVFRHRLSLKGVRLDYIQVLFKLCGFELVEMYGDFDLNEVTPESDNIIYIAKKL